MVNSILYEDSYKESYVLNEFRFSPVGLKPYVFYKNEIFDISPIEIYSNEKIINRSIEMFKNSTITEPVIDLIIKGLNNKKIVIGYTNPSKLKYIYSKFQKIFGLKRSWGVGLYDKTFNKLFIILDDNVNIFGNIITDIPLIVAHELCHMAAYQNNKTKIFNKTAKSIIIPFYTSFFGNFFLNNENMDRETFKKLFKEEKLNQTIIDIIEKIELSKEILLLNKVISVSDNWNKFGEEVFGKEYSDLGKKVTSLYMAKFWNKSTYDKKVWFNVQKSLFLAYKKIGKTLTNQDLGQELIFISEVLATTNEDGFRSEVLNCIKKIDMKD